MAIGVVVVVGASAAIEVRVILPDVCFYALLTMAISR